MNKDSVGVMISTFEKRKNILIKTIDNLVKNMPIPFSLYIYNDIGQQLVSDIKDLLPNSVVLQVFNEHGELSSGVSRHILFENMKNKFDIIISLDDDMCITKGWFDEVKKGIEHYPNHSIFTSIIEDSNGQILSAGSQMTYKDNHLIRIENRDITSNYLEAEWGSLGCLVLCREALNKKVKIPSLYAFEDDAFYLVCEDLGINKTIVCKNAVAIHEINTLSPAILRRPEKLAEAKSYFNNMYGLNV